MKSALIGHSGFVGGQLMAQGEYDDLYRSTNIAELAGRSYDLVVCAGAPAVKWLANKEPENDRRSLESLWNALEAAEVGHLVLISTVDVYPVPVEVDETTDLAAVWADPEAGGAYGRHRFELEERMRARFPTTTLRLPGLFGTGLKKNVIYDFIHDNQVDRIPPEGVFQFYDLRHLGSDIARVRAAGIETCNIATEPVSVRELARAAFDLDFENPGNDARPRYDFRTVHGAALGLDAERAGTGYLYSRDEVLADMAAFVAQERKSLA